MYVGAGYVIMRGRKTLLASESISIGKEASIFQAEAYAIDKAATKCNEILERSDKHVRIFSDSQAVLRALSKTNITSKTVLDAKIALNILKEKVTTLSLKWIKAHHGHDGNEIAD